MTAEALLAIRIPGALFPEDMKEMRHEYARLAGIWHPDRHVDPALAHTVMAHVNGLYREAVRQAKDGCWQGPGLLRIRGVDGRRREIRHFHEQADEIGTRLLGDTCLAWVADRRQSDDLWHAARMLKGFRFADERMARQMKPLLPAFAEAFDTTDGRICLVVGKPRDTFPLADAAARFGGFLPHRHAAWVVSSLLHAACWLQHAGLTHNGLTRSSAFISPAWHEALPLGGWWHAVPEGKPLRSVPAEVWECLPSSVRADGIARIETDLESIRRIGRELLDPAVADGAPDAVRNWLNNLAPDSAVKDFADWRRALTEGYGRRTFVDLVLRKEDLYGAARREMEA